MGLFQSDNPSQLPDSPPIRPRGGFRRASFGSVMVIIGAVCGGLIGMPELHRSLAKHRATESGQPPVPMSCVELIRDGVAGEQSLVRLTDSVVHLPGEIEPGGMGAAANPAFAKVQTLLADPRAKSLVDGLVRGDVMPVGAVRRPGPQPLKLAPGRTTASIAKSESESGGGLLVHVSEDATAIYLCRAGELFGLQMPPSIVEASRIPTFTLTPVSQIGPSWEAAFWVAGGSMAFVAGLLLCGSAPLGWWAIFSPLGALFSLAGMPMRGGRGGRLVWFLSTLTAFFSILGAYHLVFQVGHLGQSGGDWGSQLLGLCIACFGVAAAVGTMLSIRSRARLLRRSDPFSDFTVGGGFGATGGSAGQTKCGAGPVNTSRNTVTYVSHPSGLKALIARDDSPVRYHDPRLKVTAKLEAEGEMQRQAASLERLQFDTPLLIEISRDPELSVSNESTIQVGCRNLVMATIEGTDTGLQIRMFSFLSDGHLVISGHGPGGRFEQDCQSDAASLFAFKVSQAAKLVTQHLEAAAKTTEQRGTTMATIEANEWRDLVHVGERCIADTLDRAGLEKWDIDERQFGRFAFPPRAVKAIQALTTV